jgi:glycosyltransferase involved in cell wall biosynthesis
LVSVVICTFNRAELLADALQTICEQTINKSDYEVLVIDNNSQDSTPNLTKTFCRNYPNISYFLETVQGLSHARNRGWQEAKGLYVAYVDDDCKMPVQWLEIAMEIIDRIAPAAFGGPAYGFYNSPKPYWWNDNYGIFEHSQSARSLRKSEFLIGCNIFVRRSVLKELGGFDNTLGMYDQNLGYGEESDLQSRICASMTDEIIYYDPELFVYHLVRPEQMSLRWNLSSRFVGGRYSIYVFNDDNSQAGRPSKLKLPVQVVSILLRLFQDIIFGVLRRDRERYPYFQNYLYENTLKYVRNIGAIYEKHYLSE